jgi:hypothetical protein
MNRLLDYNNIMSEKRYRNRLKFKNVKHETESLIESDEYIGFIVGYTSNGVPYGLSQNEMDEIKDEIKNEKFEMNNLDLPF